MECADCHIPLVEQLPDEPETGRLVTRKTGRLVTILTTANPAEIAFVRSLFDDCEIPYRVKHEQAFLWGAGVNNEIQVALSDEDKARELLEQSEVEE